jgi:hexosaminidase
MKRLQTLFLIIINLCGYVFSQVPIVPLPQETIEGRGKFIIPNQEVTIEIASVSPSQNQLLFEQLQNTFLISHEITAKQVENAGNIWIGNPSNNPDLFNLLQRERIWPDERIGDQGYILHISRNRIIIAGNTNQGIFYGVQSLKQLIRASQNGEIPAVTIVDWPAMPYRTVMDDISRGPVPHTQYIKEQIIRFSEMKINKMSFYIEHIVKTKKHGSFAPADGGISTDEWKELSDFARDYHVELIGSFQTLGHFEKILSFPQYSHLGETHRMLSPVNPESVEFLKEVIGEMLPVFSSDFFNINGDEAWDLTRGSLQQLADSIGGAGIYAGHMNPVIDFIKENQKKVLMWGDIILQHPELLQLLPDDVTILTWNYSPSESFASFIDPIKESGFDFMICPGVLNSNRLIPDFRMTTANIRNFVNEGYRKGAKGVFNTVWDDGGLHSFNRTWYGVAYGADHSWNPNLEPVSDFDQRYSFGILGDPILSYTKALHKLNELTDYGHTQGMYGSIFFHGIIPAQDASLTIDMNEWDEIQETVSQAAQYLAYNQQRYYHDDIEYLQFTIDQYTYLASSRKNIIEAADLYTEALKLQSADKILTRKLLAGSLGKVIETRKSLQDLQNRFKVLWLKENRMHWYDQANDHYRILTDDYASLQSKLERAISDFDMGHYLPAPTTIRLAITEKSGSYFNYWLMTGPFHIESPEGPKPDFLTPTGGEKNATPIPGLTFTDADGISRMWDKYDFPPGSQIDLIPVFEKNTTAVIYAYCQIISPDDRNVLASFGSNDGIAVFLNGEILFEIYGKRSVIPDENQVLLPLKEGTNHLLLKIDQWQGGWGFSFRLPEETIRSHKHRYRIIQSR